MSDERTSEDVIRRYVLGALSGDELEAAEARLLTDDDFADALEAIEAELADDYVAGDLTASERAQFAGRLRTSPALRERVALAHTFAHAAARRRHSGAAAPHRASWSWLLATAAGAAVIAGGFWLTRVVAPPAAEIPGSSTPAIPPTAASNTPPVVPPPAVTTPGRGSAPVATVALFGAVVRDETAVPAFVVRDIPGQVRIEVHLDSADASPAYDVSIETGSGQLVTARQAISASKDAGGLVVAIEVPAERLPPGRYAARISGRRASTPTLIAVYPFRTTR